MAEQYLILKDGERLFMDWTKSKTLETPEQCFVAKFLVHSETGVMDLISLKKLEVPDDDDRRTPNAR